MVFAKVRDSRSASPPQDSIAWQCGSEGGFQRASFLVDHRRAAFDFRHLEFCGHVERGCFPAFRSLAWSIVISREQAVLVP